MKKSDQKAFRLTKEFDSKAINIIEQFELDGLLIDGKLWFARLFQTFRQNFKLISKSSAFVPAN